MNIEKVARVDLADDEEDDKGGEDGVDWSGASAIKTDLSEHLSLTDSGQN